MNAFQFADLCRTMLNIGADDLENAGVITPGATGGTCWERWDNTPLVFVAKLNDDRLQALVALLQELNPKAFSPPAPTQKEVDERIHLIETLRAARVYVHVASIAAAHQSNRPVLTHTGATVRNIDKALADLGAPTEIEEPTDGKAQ